jgi:hypothetical protein
MRRASSGPGGPDTFSVAGGVTSTASDLDLEFGGEFLAFRLRPRRMEMMTSSRKPMVLYIIGPREAHLLID